MTGNVENTGRDASGTSNAEAAEPVASVAEEPLLVAYFTRVDENGCERKYARTRGGREIPFLREEEAEAFFKKYTYEE